MAASASRKALFAWAAGNRAELIRLHTQVPTVRQPVVFSSLGRGVRFSTVHDLLLNSNGDVILIARILLSLFFSRKVGTRVPIIGYPVVGTKVDGIAKNVEIMLLLTVFSVG